MTSGNVNLYPFTDMGGRFYHGKVVTNPSSGLSIQKFQKNDCIGRTSIFGENLNEEDFHFFLPQNSEKGLSEEK